MSYPRPRGLGISIARVCHEHVMRPGPNGSLDEENEVKAQKTAAEEGSARRTGAVGHVREPRGIGNGKSLVG